MNDLPLSSRVAAPDTVEAPHGYGLLWRPATAEDIDAILVCALAMDPLDHPSYVTTREEIAEEFEHSYVNPSRDSMLGLDDNGVVRAYGFAILPPGQETLVRSILFGGVHPEYRGQGIGQRLLRWQRERGLQQLASSEKRLPGWLVTGAEEVATDALRLFDRAGFEAARYYLKVTRDLSVPVETRELAEDLSLEPFSAELSEATRLARNDSFRDHWGSQSSTVEEWESFVSGQVFRPDLSFLAVHTAEDGQKVVAGFVLSSVNEDDWTAAGYSSAYINLVGVGRDWRRRGIAPALLSRALQRFAEVGLERAVLDVDSVNPTGALGLYEGIGFVESSRSMNFIRVY